MSLDAQLAEAAQGLRQAGLEHAFGVTGSGPSLRLISLLESLGVRYHPASHEGAAAIMAGAAARIGGKVSVSVSIKGPGLANMLPGIAFNRFENLPALSLSEAFGPEAPAYRRHKRLDHAGLVAPVAKAAGGLADLASLLAISRAEAPGPVHVDLAPGGSAAAPAVPPPPRGSAGDVPRLLASASRPVVVAGALALRRPWGRRLDALKIPVFSTAAAKGACDERLPHSAGVFTGDGKRLAPESSLFARADLVLGLGLRNLEVLSPKPFGPRTVLLDEALPDAAEGFGAAEIFIGATAKDFDDVLGALERKSWGLDEVAGALARLREGLDAKAWLPAACFDILDRLKGPMTLVLDTGSFCTIGEHAWRAGGERLCLGSPIGRYMGGGLPTAIGAALARPGVPVVCAVGDGGMGMYPGEIRIAIEERLPVCFILMTDGRYGSIACVPQPFPASRRAVTVARPSWWKSIEAMGCEAAEVGSAEAFAARLKGWRREGPLFLEAPFDPSAYETMTAGIR